MFLFPLVDHFLVYLLLPSPSGSVSTDLECLLELEKARIFHGLINSVSFPAVVIAHHVVANCVSVLFASCLL